MLIKQSTIPSSNKGLFTLVSFCRNDIISVYLGLINSELFQDGNNEYFIGYHNCKIGDPTDLVSILLYSLNTHFCNDITFIHRENRGLILLVRGKTIES